MTGLVIGWGCVAASGFGPEELERRADGPLVKGFAAVAGDDAYLTMRGLRPLARASRLAAIAAASALGHDLGRPPAAAARHAVVLGTQWGSLEPLADFDRVAVRDGPRLTNPAAFPNVVANVHAGYLGILLELAGPNVTVCGRGAGLEAIGYALDLLETRRADYVLAGGTEAPGPTLLHGLATANGDVSTAGEGAGFLLLARDANGRSPLAACVACSSRTAHDSEALGRARAAVVAEALDGARASEVWYSGDRPDDGVLDGAPIRTLQSGCGDCRGAGGALAATVAAFSAARGNRPVVALDFPPIGTQSAALFAPV